MTLLEEEIKEKKAMLLGIIGALAIASTVHYCGYIEEHYPFFWKEKTAIVYQIQEQEAEKYMPAKPISDNPHHYIPNYK